MNKAANSIRFVSIACALVIAAGCHSDPGHPIAHDCPRNYNSEWGAVPGLTLEHWDPRLCPIPIETGQSLGVGGSVIEDGVSWPHGGDVTNLWLDAWQYYFPQTFQGSGWHAGDSEPFDFSESTGGEWMAQIWFSYNFGFSPDWLEFRVAGFGIGFPAAYVELNNGGPE